MFSSNSSKASRQIMDEYCCNGRFRTFGQFNSFDKTSLDNSCCSGQLIYFLLTDYQRGDGDGVISVGAVDFLDADTAVVRRDVLNKQRIKRPISERIRATISSETCADSPLPRMQCCCDPGSSDRRCGLPRPPRWGSRCTLCQRREPAKTS